MAQCDDDDELDIFLEPWDDVSSANCERQNTFTAMMSALDNESASELVGVSAFSEVLSSEAMETHSCNRNDTTIDSYEETEEGAEPDTTKAMSIL